MIRADFAVSVFRRSVAGVFWVSLIVGCSSTGSNRERPEWIDGPASQYPASEFLLGRGSAESVDLAQDRARADLAKIFEVQVRADAEDVQRSRREGDAVRYEAASEYRVQTRTDKVVSGIRIADLWSEPDPAAGKPQQHALATLPRAQAANALRQEIGGLDEAIAREVALSREAVDPLARSGHAMRAVEQAKRRAGFNQSLRVVELAGRGVDSPHGLPRLQSDLDAQLKRIALVPALLVGGPLDQAAIGNVVRGAIVQAGFQAAETSGAIAYGLSVNARLDSQLIDGWQWVRGGIELTLSDADGKVRGSKRWAVKASAQDEQTARARALSEIDRLLKLEMRPTLLGFAGY